MGTLQKAYVLHVRPYTDSRLLIDFLTERCGLVRAVGRAPGKRNRSSLQPFQRLEVEYRGNSDLKSLWFAEPDGDHATLLTGKSLFCGLYLNELLQRLLVFEDVSPEIFKIYEFTLAQLIKSPPAAELESVLRAFEFLLLEQLGFGIQFDVCADTERAVNARENYYFEAGVGVRQWQKRGDNQPEAEPILGADLLAIANHDFTSADTRRAAKRISRQALQPLLGSRPLASRGLFR